VPFANDGASLLKKVSIIVSRLISSLSGYVDYENNSLDIFFEPFPVPKKRLCKSFFSFMFGVWVSGDLWDYCIYCGAWLRPPNLQIWLRYLIGADWIVSRNQSAKRNF
jgi:hypothetical protein